MEATDRLWVAASSLEATLEGMDLCLEPLSNQIIGKGQSERLGSPATVKATPETARHKMPAWAIPQRDPRPALCVLHLVVPPPPNPYQMLDRDLVLAEAIPAPSV